ncbi:MAG: glycosyltransferase family 2 protein [Lachnospiraceae bacterium]|nr:glycosyltransferase family 2 protein [Lachnospiraceae bacterium]
MNKISVIIPSYNVEPYLERCVESVVNQTYRELEIILVDDGSTDATGELCDSLAVTDSRIKVVHKENGGLSDARNAGIDVAEGDFYSFVDGDDYLEKDAYEIMISEMTNDDVSLVSAGIVAEDIKGNKHLNMSKERLILSKEDALLNLLSPVRTIGQSSCNKLFRKQLFRELRYKKGIINEDMELLPKILDICNLVVLLNKPVYHYVRRSGSITESEFSMWKYEGIKNAYDTLDLCKRKYPKMVSYAHFYVMDSLFKTYHELRSSNNYRAFRKQEYSLRFRIIKEYLYCIKQDKVMSECRERVRNIAITAFFGEKMLPKLVVIKHRLMRVKER